MQLTKFSHVMFILYLHQRTCSALLMELSSLNYVYLSHSYNQLLLDDKAKQFLNINIHRSLFACNRLSFGVSSAVAIFQREMENLL